MLCLPFWHTGYRHRVQPAVLACWAQCTQAIDRQSRNASSVTSDLTSQINVRIIRLPNQISANLAFKLQLPHTGVGRIQRSPGSGIMSGSPISRRWDPLRRFQREMGRLFETLEPLHHWRIPSPYPPVNLYECGSHFVLTAELPGIAPEDIELAITGDMLTMRGERKRPEGTREETYRRQERLFGRWSRSISLPERVDSTNAAARFEQGILTISLPKAEDTRPKQIVVSAKP